MRASMVQLAQPSAHLEPDSLEADSPVVAGSRAAADTVGKADSPAVDKDSLAALPTVAAPCRGAAWAVDWQRSFDANCSRNWNI